MVSHGTHVHDTHVTHGTHDSHVDGTHGTHMATNIIAAIAIDMAMPLQ